MKNVMRVFSMMILAAGLMMAQPAAAQTKKDQKKEEKEQLVQKQEQKAIQRDYTKQASKVAKKWEKEGWKTMGKPIVKQLEETYMKMDELDANGDKRYIWTSEIVTGNSYSAAQSQADNVAKVRIASQVSSSVTSLTDVALANQEISAKDAVSFAQTVEAAKVLVYQKLGRTFKTVEVYQELANGNYRVRTIVFYDKKDVVTLTREMILKELMEKSDINKEQLEKLLGLDKLMEQVSKDMPQYDEITE